MLTESLGSPEQILDTAQRTFDSLALRWRPGTQLPTGAPYYRETCTLHRPWPATAVVEPVMRMFPIAKCPLPKYSKYPMPAYLLLLPAALVLLMSACATLPQPLQAEVTELTPAQARDAGRPGLPVRWGGRIVETKPLADRTCFDMIGSALDASGRPISMTDDASGRFVACKGGFYDPAVFLKNREVTFLGRIDGFEIRKIGEYDYRQPRMAADVIYLWPEAHIVDVRYPAPRPWPWWGWDWYGGWGWW